MTCYKITYLANRHGGPPEKVYARLVGPSMAGGIARYDECCYQSCVSSYLPVDRHAPNVSLLKYQIDVFSFGVLLAQLITGEYPRLDTRKEQV